MPLAVDAGEFKESEHPRDKGGQFTEKGGGGETSGGKPSFKELLQQGGFQRHGTGLRNAAVFKASSGTLVAIEPDGSWALKRPNEISRNGQGAAALAKVLAGNIPAAPVKPAGTTPPRSEPTPRKEPAGLATPSPRMQWVTEAAHKVASAANFPADRIRIVDHTEEVELNGKVTTLAGQSHGYGGHVVIYSKSVTPQSVAGVTAHEIMHQKFYSARGLVTDYIRQNLAELSRNDGVTPYSREHWQVARDTPNGRTISLAIDETLAEIAYLQATKRSAKLAPVWKNLYDQINSYWDQSHRRQP